MEKRKQIQDEALEAVLKRLQDYGLTARAEKCEFRKTKITFFGLVLSEDSVSMNDIKTEALKNAKIPETVSELHSFLGLSVYASRWIPNLATISEPLWKLTKKDAKWCWNEDHQKAFDTIKDSLIQSVGNFNLDWNTQLTVDASPVGLGAVLTQTDPKDANNDVALVLE